MTGATVKLAKANECEVLLVRSDRIAQHVAGGVRGYEFPTQFIQWAMIVISDSYDVALGPAHARDFLM